MRLFDLYTSKRPVDQKLSGRFYLTARDDKVAEPIWYTKNPMGKNTISSIMKNLVAGMEIDSLKKITNHSGRKTLVKKLKAAKVPESSIIMVTGHKSKAELRSYDPGDEEKFRSM